MNVFPVYLNRLPEKRTILIGGNREAERKAYELLECKAQVTVISPRLTEKLRKLTEDGKLSWISRSYQRGDLAGAFLVIVAEAEGDQEQVIYEEAEERGILINVMDDIPHCNFTFGSVVRRGPLVLSISTSGSAPALAVRLRERFEREFGEEYEQFLTFARALRLPMTRAYPSFQIRKEKWYEFVDSDVINLLRQKKQREAYERAGEILGDEPVHMALKSLQSEK